MPQRGEPRRSSLGNTLRNLQWFSAVTCTRCPSRDRTRLKMTSNLTMVGVTNPSRPMPAGRSGNGGSTCEELHQTYLWASPPSLRDYVVMELVDGQDDEAANRQKDRNHRQRNLVVRPRITFHWMARSPCKDGSLIASEEPADDALSEKEGFGFTEDGCLTGNSRPGWKRQHATTPAPPVGWRRPPGAPCATASAPPAP